MNRNVFGALTALVFLGACASPAAPGKSSSTDSTSTSSTSTSSTSTSSAVAGSVAISLTLHDIYSGTFTGNSGGGDDRNTHANGAAAYMGVIVWVEDNSGNYVKTVKYFLSDQKTTYGALYSSSAVWTHNSAAIFSAPTGIAHKWTDLYSPSHVSGVNGLDGVSGATVEVPTGSTKAYSATWDGKDYNSSPVAAGTYKIRVLVMRHSFKTYGSTEYSYSINLASGANSSGSLDSGFPLVQPGDATNASTDNGVATGITVDFTHS